MAFIITSKTRRSKSYRDGSRKKVQTQLKEVERRNNEKAQEHQERRVQKALDNWGHWDG